MNDFIEAVHLGSDREAVHGAIETLRDADVVSRIWDGDHTVWSPDPEQIRNRLGWLRSPEEMAVAVPDLLEFAAQIKADGVSDVLLLGMGGSSLAPEVFGLVFGGEGGARLAVLDSTDPGAVLSRAARLAPRTTLYVVSTKSGTTTETLSFFKYFFNRTARDVGAAAAGRSFAAITDPGSPLADLAGRHGFRRTFLNDPEVGGRFSALSYFGLAPAAIAGVDVARLLDRARMAAAACRNPAERNPGARLGAILGTLADRGRDKLTLVTPASLCAFGAWLEQLVAESTGKHGKGILPVCGEPPGPPAAYGADRVFVELVLDGEPRPAADGEALRAAGHPWITLRLSDRYDLGAQFFLWEMATAVAGRVLGIHPFDQPDVESAKISARKMTAAFRRTGRLPEEKPLHVEGPLRIYALPRNASGLGDHLKRDLSAVREGGYVALQAFLPPSPETDRLLGGLRDDLRSASGAATTVGYGPRYLHSTGQLHKGDAGRGFFLQITADHPADAMIPDEAGSDEASVSFGVLQMSQALGDMEALRAAGRRTARVHVSGDLSEGIAALRRAVKPESST